MLEDRLRGRALQRSIAVLGAVAFLVQGYNQSMMNGFLTLNTFLSTIPQIDTIHTTGAQLSHNATIEGSPPLGNMLVGYCSLLLRLGRGYLRSWLCSWCSLLPHHW